MNGYLPAGKLAGGISMEHRIVCNCCGKEISVEEGLPKLDYLYVKKEWGYFSEKDGKIHEFRICEKCYDEWVKGFHIPVHTIEVTEFV